MSLNTAGLQEVLSPILQLVFFSTDIFYYLLTVSDSYLELKRATYFYFPLN